MTKKERVLAADIDKFSEEYDTYEYWDAVDDREENVSRIYCDLQSNRSRCNSYY